MSETPAFFWADTTPDRRPITIRAKRSMLVLRHAEKLPRHVDPGELVTITQDTLANLSATDYDVVGTTAPAIADHRDE